MMTASIDLQAPPATITLRYPMQWYTPVHPHAATTEAGTLAWLADLRLLDSEAAVAKFRHLGVARYGGWPLYNADAEALATVTRFLTLWIFYDDMLEGQGEAHECLAMAAVRGEPDFDVDAGGPYLRAWWETARRYRNRMDTSWCARLGDRFGEWLRAVREEAEQLRILRSEGRHPEVLAYIACRRRSIGVYPTLNLLEYACGCALPDELRTHPGMAALERSASELVFIQNDLVSVPKDARDSGVNLVFSIAQDKNCSLAEACREMERMHDTALRGFLDAAGFLRSDHPECTALHEWLAAAETMCHGFARWHISNTRYDRELALGDGTSVRIEVEYV
jgi:epi-isozizaene synthase